MIWYKERCEEQHSEWWEWISSYAEVCAMNEVNDSITRWFYWVTVFTVSSHNAST